MTNPNQPDSARRRPGLVSMTLVALLSASLAFAPGCSKPKKKPPPPPPPKPVAPPPPEPVDIQALMQELHPDARVKFADGQAPADRTLAEGVIHLADYIAKGDAKAMKKMLDRSAQTVLDELVSTGSWGDETKKIEQVRVVYLSDTSEPKPDSATVGIAIQDPAGAYMLGWTLKREGENWVAAAAPAPADSKSRASDFDGTRVSAASSVGPSGGGDEGTETADSSGPGKKPDEGTPGSRTPKDEPGRKNTPGGPIKVPGTPPGGSRGQGQGPA